MAVQTDWSKRRRAKEREGKESWSDGNEYTSTKELCIVCE
jgi:hypothetical protein